MNTASTVQALRTQIAQARAGRETIGLVPTMGALHQGHLSLVRAAKHRDSFVAVSIFVNPAQFGPKEDWATYPRSIEKDKALLEREQIDVLFVPSVEEMYDTSPLVWVEVAELSGRNEGRVRPGHFRGVATVVAKLFNIVQPDSAYFGQKDAAQLAVIRQMTRELRFPIEIVGCPIVREADGLAMSSRNVYLSATERRQATVLHRALLAAERAHGSGIRDAQGLADAAWRVFRSEPQVSVDYLELLDPDTLLAVERVERHALLAVAARVGATRLLDNVILGG